MSIGYRLKIFRPTVDLSSGADYKTSDTITRSPLIPSNGEALSKAER